MREEPCPGMREKYQSGHTGSNNCKEEMPTMMLGVVGDLPAKLCWSKLSVASTSEEVPPGCT